MSKQCIQTNEQTLATFIAHKAEIDALLAWLQGASADHFGANPDEVHWGHAGSLGHVAERLREIVAFLKI